MNTAAYLERQGWRGKGFALDNHGRGLANPLLVSHKRDSAGLGTKKHDFTNEWWLKAWDKPIGDKTSVPTTATIKPHPLYANFVKAQPLEGTISATENSSSSSDAESMKSAKGSSGSSGQHLYKTSVPNGVILGDVAESAIDTKTPLEIEIKTSKKRKHDAGDAQDEKSKRKEKKRKKDSLNVGSAEEDVKKSKKEKSKKPKPSLDNDIIAPTEADFIAIPNGVDGGSSKSKDKKSGKSKKAKADKSGAQEGVNFVVDTAGEKALTPPAPASKRISGKEKRKNQRYKLEVTADGQTRMAEATPPPLQTIPPPRRNPDGTLAIPSIKELVRAAADPNNHDYDVFGVESLRPTHKRAPRTVRKEARALVEEATRKAAVARGEPDPATVEKESLPPARKGKSKHSREPTDKQAGREIRKQEKKEQNRLKRKQEKEKDGEDIKATPLDKGLEKKKKKKDTAVTMPSAPAPPVEKAPRPDIENMVNADRMAMINGTGPARAPFRRR